MVVRRMPMPLPATSVAAVSHASATGLRTMRARRQAVATFRPDVLHVQCFGPNGAYSTALARLTGVPLVVTLQGETSWTTPTSSRCPWSCGHRCGPDAHRIGGHRLFGIHPGRCRLPVRTPAGRGTVIPNGVALDGSGPDGPVTAPDGGLARLGDTSYILALGRAVEKKGFDLLLAGYAAMDPAGARPTW